MNEMHYWILYRAAFKLIPLTQEEITDIRALYAKEGRENVYAHAKKKKIIPGIAYLLTKLDLDADYWKHISDSFRERNERVITYLDCFYETMTKAGITHIAVVENFGALLHAQTDLALFGSGDTDNFGDRAEQEHIYQILTKEGYQLEDTKAGFLLISTEVHLKDTNIDNYHFGINWDVTNRVNLPCLTSKSDFFDWQDCTYYKSTHIRLPSPEALMYVCLMHIAVHGFCKAPDIRLYFDIANVASKPLDWSKIVKWAIRDENCLRIATATTLTNRLLGVSIPEEVMNLGNPRRRERLLRHVSIPEQNALKDFPSRFTSFFIDVLSCDKGVFSGLKYVFFPPRNWVIAKYGSATLGRIKHILNLL